MIATKIRVRVEVGRFNKCQGKHLMRQHDRGEGGNAAIQ